MGKGSELLIEKLHEEARQKECDERSKRKLKPLLPVHLSVESVMGCVPHGLESLSQFILWTLTLDGVKIPCDGTGAAMNAHDESRHRKPDVLAPLIIEERGRFGLAFVIKPDDDYFFIDLDGVRDASGNWMPLVHEICAMFPGAAMEVSMSGTGIHIIGRGSSSIPSNHGCRVKPHLELYTRNRFVALTGMHRQGRADLDFRHVLPQFVQRYGFKTDTTITPVKSAPGDDVTYDGPEDDAALVELIKNSDGSMGQLFGAKCHSRTLLAGDVFSLMVYYPVAEGKPRPDKLHYDASSADLALCNALAFWTGRDAARMKRLWLASGLAGNRRNAGNNKLRVHPSYVRDTIQKAIAGCTAVYSRKARREENAIIGEDLGGDLLPSIMTLNEMLERLVYAGANGGIVIDRQRIRPRPVPDAYKEYAASIHESTDPETLKIKRTPALKLWVQSPQRKTVDVLTWGPGKPEFCAPPDFTNGNTKAYNTWKGLPPLKCPDDWQDRAKPFIDHIQYLVPIDDERKRFTQWLGHILQRPGELPHTCYLMVATQTGIGRNWLTGVLCRVLRGHVAASVPLAKILDGGFNGQLSQKLLAVVDEVRQGNHASRYERGEKLKQIITEDPRPIDDKYGRQWREFNCCRWIMLSNHMDALPFDNNDRRVIVIENPSERRAPEYYRHLYRVMHTDGFAGSVRRWLESVDLIGFNPGEPAPMNNAKQRALDSMTSPTEQTVMEFKRMWPGIITGRKVISKFVNRETGTPANENHLTHAIQRAGMITTGVRIPIGFTRDTVIIMDALHGSIDQVKAADKTTMARYIAEIDAKFTL